MFFRYCAILIFIFIGAVVTKASVADRERQLAHYRGICSLLVALSEGIERYLAPIDSILSDFKCDTLSECGFLDSLKKRRGGADFSCLHIDVESQDKLRSFFNCFGRGYAEEELRAISELLSFFKERCRIAEESCPKDKKIALTLFAGFAGGVFLLLI